jgi:hypothetical protein
MKFNERILITLILISVIFIMMLIPVAAANEEITAVQTSDYTFIINAILLIFASGVFILVRIKRRNKK